MRQRPPERSDADIKARADKLFKIKEAQRIDAPFAMAEYRAAEIDARQKMARLRAERLAQEAGQETGKGSLAAPGKSGGKPGAKSFGAKSSGDKSSSDKSSSDKPSGTSRP